MLAYVGDIYPWAGPFAPRGFVFCHGQELPLSQFRGLYALLQNRYGGDGRTTFAVPDLRGRVPVGAGEAFGRSFTVAERLGDGRTEVSETTGGVTAGTLPAAPAPGEAASNVSPSLGINYIIAVKGVYPSRS